MPTLRLRLIGLFVLLALAVAAVMILAVQRFGSEQIMKLAMESGSSEEEARAMFDTYIGGVLLIGAAVSVPLGALAAWWLLRRILQPLERLTRATMAIARGDLAARVPPAPDPELQRLGDSFNAMATALEHAEGLRRRLVEDLAHELRTPLTSLQGYLEALADGVIEATPEILRTVHEEIVRITRLVEELDRLARLGGASGERAREPVDLAAVVRRMAAIYAPELAARQINLRLELSGGLPMVSGDQDALGQVLTNLLQNAARYSNDGGEVVVELSVAAAGWLRCAVENSGPDIPPDELPLIWERLYRVDPSRARSSGGAGIGLAIVRQIVEEHRGRVGASSAAGRTRIWFELPAA
ncbi:MAG TPA: ATP-binding protein [Candidatus Limnocylindria bacterium]|nr:ATP-binding protein [Candidatus Limnocylindria bacterium]